MSRFFLSGVGWGGGVFFLSVAIAAAPIRASEALFPEARHFVKRISDPISEGVSSVDQYCEANRIVTVQGNRVAIADYGKQELIEIDRDAGTYSITPFDAIAKANQAMARTQKALPQKALAAPGQWKTTELGSVRSASGRAMSAVQLERDDVTIEVGLDSTVRLSRAAVEALIGAAYPNPSRPEHEAILGATRVHDGRLQVKPNAGGRARELYALPLEQKITYRFAGETVTVSSSIVDVSSDRAPPDILMIPPGAKLVESRLTRLPRELHALDQLPGAALHH